MKCEVPQQSFHQDLGELNVRLRHSNTSTTTARCYWLGRPSKAQQAGHMSVVLQTGQYHIKLHLLHTQTTQHSVTLPSVQWLKGYDVTSNINYVISCLYGHKFIINIYTLDEICKSLSAEYLRVHKCINVC